MHQVDHKSLKTLNTFGIDVQARKYISIESIAELKEILKGNPETEFFILGGGSNMLLTTDLDQTVLHINIKGKTILSKETDSVIVEAMAGENWHEFVLWCIDQDFGGLENLSLIPGRMGTVPIQNIGAYGVEIKDTFISCEALNRKTLEIQEFTKADCQFGYRDSIFKNVAKNKYIILSVTFKLSRENHQLHTSYGAIGNFLKTEGIENPGIKEISDAVIQIRQSKLPDPKSLGNSGSFFKNSIVPLSKLESLQQEFPEIPFYTIEKNLIKIPAGWLIERAGYKGFRKADAGVHSRQALVLINYGNASGQEILQLSKEIQAKVFKLFGISLETEVNIF